MMSCRPGTAERGTRRATVALGVLVLASLALGGCRQEPLDAFEQIAREDHFSAGSVSFGYASFPDPTRAPFRSIPQVAIDSESLPPEAVFDALRPLLEQWTGEEGIELIPMPEPGTVIDEPLLALSLADAEWTWSHPRVKQQVLLSVLAVDPTHEFAWPDIAMPDLGTGDAPRRMETPPTYVHYLGITPIARGSLYGSFSREKMNEGIAQAIADTVLSSIAEQAQSEGAAPPNDLVPEQDGPLVVSAPGQLRISCEGEELDYELRRATSWYRHYELAYEDGETCTLDVVLSNASKGTLELEELSMQRDEGSESDTLWAWGEPSCRPAGGDAWAPCRDLRLRPGESVQLRSELRFQNCERWLGDSRSRAGRAPVVMALPDDAETVMEIGLFSATTLATSLQTSRCSRRYPGEAASRRIVDWLLEDGLLASVGTQDGDAEPTLRYIGWSGPVRKRGDEALAYERREPHRNAGFLFAAFEVEHEGQICLGAVGYDRYPPALLESGEPLSIWERDMRGADVLHSMAARCGDIEEAAAEGAFVFDTELRGSGKMMLIAGRLFDPKIDYLAPRAEGHPLMENLSELPGRYVDYRMTPRPSYDDERDEQGLARSRVVEALDGNPNSHARSKVLHRFDVPVSELHLFAAPADEQP